tara:strand:+ start:61 stop:234 length:174 start_codon:yes stop_codon:yes gene_type:complete
MKDQPNTLTEQQFSLLIQLIDLGVKTAGLQCINAETNGAVQAFAQLKPEQPEPEVEE